MSDILGYFGDKKGKPIAYMRNSGLILFSNKKELVKYNYLGGFDFLNRVISSGNRDVFSKNNKNKQRAGGKSQLYVEQQGKSQLYVEQQGKSQLYVEQQATSRMRKQRAGGGLFGESQGSCGWGNNPSCCFTSCAPLWRTSVWPFSNTIM
jgi:hypothetical protein